MATESKGQIDGVLVCKHIDRHMCMLLRVSFCAREPPLPFAARGEREGGKER